MGKGLPNRILLATGLQSLANQSPPGEGVEKAVVNTPLSLLAPTSAFIGWTQAEAGGCGS
jgi:hypothetical protein